MAEGFGAILITAIVLCIVVAVVIAIMNWVIPHLTPPLGQIVNIIMWGIVALLVVIYILIPLIRLIPAAA